MRAMAWLIGAAAVGGLAGGGAAKIFPTVEVSEAVHALGEQLSGLPVASLNPIRAAYDVVSAKIQAGTTMDELGFHPSPVTITPPDPKNWQGVGFNFNSNGQNGWAQTIAAQNRDFNNRMEDMRNYARNPMAWHGPPPN